MEKKTKNFSIFDVQGERVKLSSFDRYQEESSLLLNKIYSSRLLLEEEIMCSHVYYKQLLSWAELIASKEIDITDILAKGKYSNIEKATKKIALLRLIGKFKDFFKSPSYAKKYEIYKRFGLINLRRDSLTNIKNGILAKRIPCSDKLYDKIVLLNNIIEESCGKLVSMYMPYAINLANKRGIRYDEDGNPIGNFVDDYTQAALIGIYEAAKHFDPTKNISFTTYAWYWMIQGFSEVFESSDIIRFPRNVMLLRNKISKTSGETITASISDLSKRYGQTEGAIQKALDCNRTISLDKTISTNNKEESLLADLADGHNVEKDVERINEREIVLDVIKNNLNEREQEFIYMRFGFNKNAPHTLKEIAQKVDMTTEGVRQAIKNALIKIVPDIVNKLGENYGEQDTEKVLKMLGTGKQ